MSDRGTDPLFGTTAETPLLVPTNRFNLLEILASRVIAPRAAYDKYYTDLLELAPGRIPVIAGPVGARTIELVTREGDATFPVLLELRRAVIKDVPVSALGPGGEPAT